MIPLTDYFQRIGYEQSPEVDLATLKSLHSLHPASVAFENIDVLLDSGINLDMSQICNKLIYGGRGGYCFEQNNLFMAVLRRIGFEVEPLMARVLWQTPSGAPANPRTHMVLRTLIEGTPWLVDVGFGGLVLTTPLQFVPDLVQTTHHETFRLKEFNDGYILEVLLAGQWQPVYHLGAEVQQPIDIEVANWYTSTHPNSKFRQNLLAARATKETRYTLLNNHFTVRHSGQEPERQTLNTDELVTVLRESFLLPVQADWRHVLHQIVNGAT